MQRNTFTIKIPRPCSENWEAMTPVGKGRFCASCQKTVVDFSRFTDAEIVRILRTGKDRPQCGNFHFSQVDRELIDLGKKSSFSSRLLKRIAAAVLFFQTIAVSSWSQTTRTAATQHAETRPGDTAKNSQRFFWGRVANVAKGQRLDGIIVEIEGTDITAITDTSGNFRILLPDTFSASEFSIIATFVPQRLESPFLRIRKAEVNLDKLPGQEVVLYRTVNEHVRGDIWVDY